MNACAPCNRWRMRIETGRSGNGIHRGLGTSFCVDGVCYVSTLAHWKRSRLWNRFKQERAERSMNVKRRGCLSVAIAWAIAWPINSDSKSFWRACSPVTINAKGWLEPYPSFPTNLNHFCSTSTQHIMLVQSKTYVFGFNPSRDKEYYQLSFCDGSPQKYIFNWNRNLEIRLPLITTWGKFETYRTSIYRKVIKK